MSKERGKNIKDMMAEPNSDLKHAGYKENKTNDSISFVFDVFIFQ